MLLFNDYYDANIYQKHALQYWNIADIDDDVTLIK